MGRLYSRCGEGTIDNEKYAFLLQAAAGAIRPGRKEPAGRHDAGSAPPPRGRLGLSKKRKREPGGNPAWLSSKSRNFHHEKIFYGSGTQVAAVIAITLDCALVRGATKTPGVA